MNAVITPAADDVRRTFNVFEVGQLALPVVIEVGVLESTIGSIFDKVAAPVPEYRVPRCKSVLHSKVTETVSWDGSSQATELRFGDSSLKCHLAVKVRHSVNRNDSLSNEKSVAGLSKKPRILTASEGGLSAAISQITMAYPLAP
jgi:hypothetical protein